MFDIKHQVNNFVSIYGKYDIYIFFLIEFFLQPDNQSRGILCVRYFKAETNGEKNSFCDDKLHQKERKHIFDWVRL